MITLTGKLRQIGTQKFKDETRPEALKLVIEHETKRNDGTTDLHLETMFLPIEDRTKLPPEGSLVEIEVNPWVSGRNVAYSASSVIGKAKAA